MRQNNPNAMFVCFCFFCPWFTSPEWMENNPHIKTKFAITPAKKMQQSNVVTSDHPNYSEWKKNAGITNGLGLLSASVFWHVPCFKFHGG
jgi:hypothetical protein